MNSLNQTELTPRLLWQRVNEMAKMHGIKGPVPNGDAGCLNESLSIIEQMHLRLENAQKSMKQVYSIISRHQSLSNCVVDWQAVDWSLTNTRLSEQLGVSIITVARHRRKFGLPNGKTGRKKQFNVDWSQVNWTLSNKQIAKQVGCSTEYVCIMRRRHERPLATSEQYVEMPQWESSEDEE